MSGSWRDFTDRLTDQTRLLFERGEQRGDDPDDLRELAEQMLEAEAFKLACEAVAVEPTVEGAASAWMPPDEQHPVTYREITVRTASVGAVTVDTTVEVDLDGGVLAAFIYLSADAPALTAAEARRAADELRRAADRLDSL